MVFWLSSLPLLVACFLPWVLLRPNRLAQGAYLKLPPAQLVVGFVLVAILMLGIRFWPRILPLLSSLLLALGFLWIGGATNSAMQGQSEIARASASSGFWVWLLGASIAVYGAGLTAPLLTAPLLTAPLSITQVTTQVWQKWLAWLWLPLLLLIVLTGLLNHWSVIQEFGVQKSRFFQELGQHLKLVLSSLGFALLLGVPLAVWASRNPKISSVVLGLANSVQTIPSLALLGLLIAPLAALSNTFPFLQTLGIRGIGTTPALIAMTLYALLPVLRNGIVALRGVSAGVLDAARGMGMTDNQRFIRVQLPLALPVWLSGVRQAAVMLVGVASVAQLIGAGGLGFFIFSGLQSGANDLVLLGAIPAAFLAVFVDTFLRLIEQLLGRKLGQISA